jgi:hypothetical protein
MFVASVFILIEILLVSILVRDAWLLENMEKENQKNAYYFSTETSMEITRKSRESYDSIFVHTGIVDQSYYMFLPQKDTSDTGLDLSKTGVFNKMANVLDTFWIVAYQLITRAHVWVIWLPAVLLFFIPAVIDGIAMRKVKIATHATTSSIRMKYAIMMIVGCLFIFLLSLFSPFAVSPLLYLILSLLGTYMISVILANTQKDI